MDSFAKVVADLATAKENVRWLLDHPTGLVDMKGLVHWAKRVEAARDQIKEAL